MGGLTGRAPADRGSVFLDILVALLIASIALVVTLGGIALAARTAGQSKERIIRLISDRNENAESQEISFSKDLSKE